MTSHTLKVYTREDPGELVTLPAFQSIISPVAE